MGSCSRTPVTLGASVLVLCAFVAATFDGPVWVAEAREAEPVLTEPGHRPQDLDEQPADEQPRPEEHDVPTVPGVPPLHLLLLVPAALVLAIGLLVLSRLRLVRRRRQLTRRVGVRRAPVPQPQDGDEAEEEGALPGALGRGIGSLGEGSPRNAIVAAWVRLEEGIASERFPRRPQETPTEVVERALTAYRLEADAIRRLAALYREARFSRHPVTEEHRAEARACLHRLLDSLGASR